MSERWPVRDFRSLLVWQRAHALVIATRKVTRRLRNRDYAPLRSQMTRGAESIAANIVEGCFATSQREFARFLAISLRSAGELEYHIQLAQDYGLLSPAQAGPLIAEAVEIRKMLIGLRRRVLAAASPQRQPTKSS